jgi:plastocyanin
MTAVAPRPPVVTTPPDAAPRGDRFVGVGLLLLAALFGMIQLLAREVIPPLAGSAVVYLALGAAVLRWRSRGLLIGVTALLVIHLVTSIPFFTEALAHPETPATFLPDTFIGIVALATIAGAIASLRRARSRRPITGVAVALAVLAVGVSVVASGGVESEAQQPGDVAVETVRAQFPAQLEVPAGGAVLWVDNQDALRHTFVIEGTDVHAELPGSTAVRVETELAAGTYRYFCDVPGHERMAGELVAR